MRETVAFTSHARVSRDISATGTRTGGNRARRAGRRMDHLSCAPEWQVKARRLITHTAADIGRIATSGVFSPGPRSAQAALLVVGRRHRIKNSPFGASHFISV